MADKEALLPTSANKGTNLTQGLGRNIAFNALGWIWPVGLAIASVPYTVKTLGNDAYGIFAIVSIVAGYLGLLNGPVAMGNVRFMAEAYAREDWSRLREVAIAGLIISSGLSLAGATVLFLAADVLAQDVFQIPPSLIPSAVLSFRLAALGFFLNGIVGTLQGIPVAIRRFDVRNEISLIAGTINTLGVVVALWLGWGLLGAVMAQVLSSGLALMLFALAALLLFRKFPGSIQESPINRYYLKRLTSFSFLLFAGQVTSQIGLQIDRVIVGILLGTSAVTFYIVPTKITDKVPGMMQIFSATLYPLSSEAVATDKLDELFHLYREMIRILFWLSTLVATIIIALSRDLLALWIGPEFMVNSWLVLALLAGGVAWRASGSIAYQVCNGMGRADINLVASVGTAVFIVVPVLLLAPIWGAPGAALGVCIGLAVSNVAYDLFTQRKLLGAKNWVKSLSPYVRVVAAEGCALLVFKFLPLEATGWFGLIFKAGLISGLYTVISLATGALRVRDLTFLLANLHSLSRKALSPALPRPI